MNAKAIIVAVVLAVLTVVTFPLSVGGWLIYGVWRYLRQRRCAVAVYHSHPTRVARYEAALADLDRQIADTIRETELLAQIKYKEWLLDKERRKQYWVTHGVTLPETVRQRELDQFFSAMQQRLEARQAEFEREAARIGHEERRQLTYQRERDEAAERAQAAEEAQAAARQLEQERRAACARGRGVAQWRRILIPPPVSKPHMTISAAARQYGVNRRTIQRKIVRGELERIALPDGSVGVTVASLVRAFRGAASGAPDAAGEAAPAAATPRDTAAAAGLRHAALDAAGAVELAALRAELAGAHAVIAAKEAHLADLRQQLDQAHSERRDLQAALGRAQTNLLVAQAPDAARGRTGGGEASAVPVPVTPVSVPARRGRARPTKATAPAAATSPAPSPASGGWWGRLRRLGRR